jgi:hypothetical protein
MAYQHVNSKGQTYYLHAKDVVLRGGRQQRIYYFARDVRPNEAIDSVPAGYEVVENPRNGFLALRRS